VNATRCVWVDSWAYQCCGTEFAVGSTVEWNLRGLSDGERRFFTIVLGAEQAARITDAHDDHGIGDHLAIEVQLVTGVVMAVDDVSWKVHPLAEDNPTTDAMGFYAAPGTLRIERRSSAQKWGSASGFLVELEVE